MNHSRHVTEGLVRPWIGLQWARAASRFVALLYDPSTGGYRSVPGGPVTLYGTAYGLLTRHYLGEDVNLTGQTRRFLECQDPETGYLLGPELQEWAPPAGAVHDRGHLLFHLACAVLPAMQEFGALPRYPLCFAHRFCDLSRLAEWLDRRDLANAWLEGNNLLFIGQFLVYLRDVEKHPDAHRALDLWFRWLDDTVDPATGLWGTKGGQCSPFIAMCGGYHQLLVYYHEGRSLTSPERLVDTVLRLQHADGGFAPTGGGGACEDVDAVDILVNLYKRFDYRRADIRATLRRALDAILAIQNDDGGFPYNRVMAQSHMGVPGTAAPAGVSTMFATWFRVHTLALIAEVLTDDLRLAASFRFNRFLSMGWHLPWARDQHRVSAGARLKEFKAAVKFRARGVGRRLLAQVSP